jgi:lipoprotein-anchoring transpeptidase ErfK/SrfK
VRDERRAIRQSTSTISKAPANHSPRSTRIDGTNRPDTIGTAVSSGCFRLVNTDVADLYERVPVGTKVIIRQKPEL